MDPKQRQFSFWYVLIALWALIVIQFFATRLTRPREIPYSEFKAAVAAGKVEEVSISATMIHGRMKAEAAPASSPPGTPASDESRAFDTVRVEDPDLIRD